MRSSLVVPVGGYEPFRWLQVQQHATVFSLVLSPLHDCGVMWSSCKESYSLRDAKKSLSQ
jgi:hypothetical protein